MRQQDASTCSIQSNFHLWKKLHVFAMQCHEFACFYWSGVLLMWFQSLLSFVNDYYSSIELFWDVPISNHIHIFLLILNCPNQTWKQGFRNTAKLIGLPFSKMYIVFCPHMAICKQLAHKTSLCFILTQTIEMHLT